MSSSLDRDIQEAYNEACQTFAGEASLIKKLTQIRNDALELASFAHEYDFPGVPCNGYRTAIDMAIKLFRYGAEHYDRPHQEYLTMVRFFICGMKYFQQIRQKTKDHNIGTHGAKRLFDDRHMLACDSFYGYIEKRAMDGGLGPLIGFYYNRPERVLSQAVHYGVSIISVGNVWKTIQSLFDPDLRRENMRTIITNMRIEYLKVIDLVGNSWYVKNMSPLSISFFHPTTRQAIFVPRQRKFRINCNPQEQTAEVVKHDGEVRNTDSTVRCRYLYDWQWGKTPNGSVILHVHGGGFVIGSPDGHETYTRYWVNNIPGVPFISVDYGLSPETQFPESLQQILDVFLWLHTSDAEQLLGFKPTKIVCCGDSSGGLMLLATIAVLNDIKKKWPADVSFFMPTGFVAIYPSFCLSPRASPSLFLAGVHPILIPSAFLNMITAYVPIRDKEFNQQTRRSCRKDMVTRLDRLIRWLMPPQDDSTDGEKKSYVQEKFWWNQSLAKSNEFLDQWQLLNHPYASPLLYDDFESLRDIELSLLVCPTDPILDHAISLANMWKGKVSLKTFDNMIHGFLPMVFLKGAYKEHNDTCISELKRLLRYPY